MEVKGLFFKKREELNLETLKTLKDKSAPNPSQGLPKNAPSQGEESISQKELREEVLPPSQEPPKNAFLERLNKILFSYHKALKIEIDEDLKIPVYKIIDLETKEVLKQIPLEDLLKLKKAIKDILEKELKKGDFLKGIFFEREV